MKTVRRKKVKPRFFILVVLTTVIVFGCGYIALQNRIAETARQLQQVRQQEQTLMEEVEDLEEQKRYVQSEDYVIDSAREELDMLMPGEIQYTTEGK